jgi:ABC-type uncharacterized transport system substrate-binding protein
MLLLAAVWVPLVDRGRQAEPEATSTASRSVAQRVGWSIAARAQQNAMPVIGYLSTRSTESERPMLAAFTRSLGDMGYVLDKNVAIEFRSGNGQYDLLRTLAEDLVRRQVAVIVAAGGSHPALAAKAATAKIPIVFNVGDDPVQVGLVASLSRPGANVTGVASLLAALGAKQLGLIRELVPKATVVAILVNPLDPWTEAFTADTRAAARALGQQLVILKASSEREIDAAFAALRQQGVGALLVNGGPLFVTQANQVIALAARSALPAIYFRREFADAGGVMSRQPKKVYSLIATGWATAETITNPRLRQRQNAISRGPLMRDQPHASRRRATAK